MYVDGMFSGFHLSATLWPSSQPIGNFAPYVFAKPAMPFFSSSTETAAISRPLDLYFTYNSWSFGNDFLHGSHHVAQKSTMTTLPEGISTLPAVVSDGSENVAAFAPLPPLLPSSDDG